MTDNEIGDCKKCVIVHNQGPIIVASVNRGAAASDFGFISVNIETLN